MRGGGEKGRKDGRVEREEERRKIEKVKEKERRKEGKVYVMKGGKEEDRKGECDEGEESRYSRKKKWM